METVEFFVPGIARPQTRPKTFRNPKTGGVVTSSSSKPVRNWRERIYVEAQVVKPPSPWEGPVSMTAIFVFSRPAGHYRKNGELSAEGRRRPKPMGGVGDWDNLGKAVSDALEGLFFGKDSQLAPVLVDKVYCGREQQPGVHITIRRHEEEVSDGQVAHNVVSDVDQVVGYLLTRQAREPARDKNPSPPHTVCRDFQARDLLRRDEYKERVRMIFNDALGRDVEVKDPA